MLSSLLIALSPLIGKIIGWTILMGFFCLFLKWRFKSWKEFEEEMRDWETILIRNIGILCIFLIMLFTGLLVGNGLQEKEILSSEYLVSGIGLIVAFWYGYKKYERDKEIQMIEQYSGKYNVIKDKITQSVKPTNKDYTELLTLWYEEYFLFDKGYISSELWNEWEYWIKRDITHFLWEGEKIFSSNMTSEIDDNAMWVHCMDSCIFLDLICQDYIPNPKKQEEFLYKDKFSRYLVNLIKLEENKISEYRDAKWKYGLNELITILTKTEI